MNTDHENWDSPSPCSRSSTPPVNSVASDASPSLSPSPIPQSPGVYPISGTDHYVTFTDLMMILRDYVRVEDFNILKAENERLRKQLQKCKQGGRELRTNEDDYSPTTDEKLKNIVLNSKDSSDAVKNAMKLLFSEDEILSCSVSGQKGRLSIEAKPRFDPIRYGLMLRTVRATYPMKVTDITKKVHGVQKTIKRSRATKAARSELLSDAFLHIEQASVISHTESV